MKSASTRFLLVSLVAFSGLAAGCDSPKKIDLGGECKLNSDCNSPLLCSFGKCHTACVQTRDCPVGQSCVMAAGGSVCQLPAEADCRTASCEIGTVCAVDHRCRTVCQNLTNCTPGQVCVSNVCADGTDLDPNGQLPQTPPPKVDSGADAVVCPAGSETCACYGNDTCNVGLTCASHLCVRLGTGGTTGTDASAGNGGTSGSGGKPGTGGMGGPAGGSGGAGGRDASDASSDAAGTPGSGGVGWSDMAEAPGSGGVGRSDVAEAPGSGGVGQSDASSAPNIPVPCSGITDGMVACYPFTGNANDESAYANHGTVNGPVLVADRFGAPESAYQFDGVDDYIEAPDAAQQHVDAVTVSAWVKPAAAGVAQWCQEPQILFKRNHLTANFEGYIMRLSGGDPEVGVAAVASSSGAQVGVAGTTPIQVGEWVHLVMTANGSTIALYQDGELLSSTATGFPLDVGNRPLVFGATNEWCGGHFNGLIDDIRIYNRVLSVAEISQLHAIESGL
jgi:hypothetical protein